MSITECRHLIVALIGAVGCVGQSGCNVTKHDTPFAMSVTGDAVRTPAADRDIGKGDTAPDFSIVDAHDHTVTFRSIRKRVTALAFTQDSAWPHQSDLSSLYVMIRRVEEPEIPVGIVIVGQSSQPCREIMAEWRSGEPPPEQITLVCDQDDQIRSLYGPNAGGKFFIVGDMGWVSHVGVFSDRGGLERGLASAVQRVAYRDFVNAPK